jgi:hypothetical protein
MRMCPHCCERAARERDFMSDNLPNPFDEIAKTIKQRELLRQINPLALCRKRTAQSGMSGECLRCRAEQGEPCPED